MDSVLKSIQELKQTQAADKRDIDQKLQQFESNVSAGQEEAIQRVVKKLHCDRRYEFRKKGHEKQYQFNDELADCLASTSKLLSSITPAPDQANTLKKAQDELGSGMAAIASRQKQIRIADRHDLGWSVVEAYEDDELASGEEDVKRLEKAERVAEQKAAKKKKASTRCGRMPPNKIVGQHLGLLASPKQPLGVASL